MTALLQSGKRPRIAVVGDYCLDKYMYREKELDEPSVETGLVAWQIRAVKNYAGVGGTITANLTSLGADVFCVGLCGNDGNGFELLESLRQLGADTSGMIQSPLMLTNTYIKPMVWEKDRWVEMNRIDIRNSVSAKEATVEEALDRLVARLPELDAVIISDQFTFESGSILTPNFRVEIAQLAREFPNVLFFGDSRANLRH